MQWVHESVTGQIRNWYQYSEDTVHSVHSLSTHPLKQGATVSFRYSHLHFLALDKHCVTLPTGWSMMGKGRSKRFKLIRYLNQSGIKLEGTHKTQNQRHNTPEETSEPSKKPAIRWTILIEVFAWKCSLGITVLAGKGKQVVCYWDRRHLAGFSATFPLFCTGSPKPKPRELHFAMHDFMFFLRTALYFTGTLTTMTAYSIRYSTRFAYDLCCNDYPLLFHFLKHNSNIHPTVCYGT